MPESPQALDSFVTAFAQFMESGDTGALSSYCDRGTNPDLFNIYRNGFYRACVDALASNYPATVALLGETYFRSIARTYVQQHPPQSGSLTGYSKNFPEYLGAIGTSLNLPYLENIADLDRAWFHVYFSRKFSPLTAERIAALAAQGMELDAERIALTNSRSLLSLTFPVAEIWRALKDVGSLQEPVELPEKPQSILLWRCDSEVMLRQLSDAEHTFFSCFGDGLPLDQAVEQAYSDDAELELENLLLNLITAGLLIETRPTLQAHQQETES